MFAKPLATIFSFAVLALVSACGDRSADSASTSAGAASTSAASTRKASNLDADLVKASSPSKTGAAMDMRFKLANKPEAGKPVALTLVFQPPEEEIDRMTVSLSASDGLSIESGEGPAIFVPSHGALISHEMSVKAERDGIYFVSASVLVDGLNNNTSSRSFSLPIIVGEGVAAAVPSPAGSVTQDSSGEHVKAVPARAKPAPRSH